MDFRNLVTCLFLIGLLIARPQPGSGQALPAHLDQRGPYLFLITKEAAKQYAQAIAAARKLHPQAVQATFAPEDLSGAQQALQRTHPRYALVFIQPEELDVNFAWRWLTLTTRLNDDPFVDVRTGFITGETPEAAARFLRRIQAVVDAQAKLPATVIDNLGPNTSVDKHAFLKMPRCFMLPVLGHPLGAFSISHGAEGFDASQLASMEGAGIIHLGGHGSAEHVDDGITAAQARQLKLSPCIVFSGACYTGVTCRWFDQWTQDGRVAEQTVPPSNSFCLSLLSNQAIAYLASLHPDHGMPVYQEMEYLAYSGASLGDVIKHTQDGVILASGGRVPAFERLTQGMAAPHWTDSDVMLKGTASRVLFGDPALIVTAPLCSPPFRVSVESVGADTLSVKAVLINKDLMSTYTDTYHADLASDKQLFNDRALLVAPLPAGWNSVRSVQVVRVTAHGKTLPYRLIGSGLEKEGKQRRLHVQVDVPSQGYLQSDFRSVGAEVVLKVSR